jgi:hypothetical protein
VSTPAAEAYQQMNAPLGTPQVMIDPQLDHSHRCDKCGAQAWVRSESRYSTLQLTWCAHHYAEVEPHFSDETHVILDERRFLNAAVKAQANYANGVG